MKISGRLKEAIGVAAVLLGVMVMQGDLWITGKRMLSHDSIIWFGAFSYFADCLQHGILPLWNPYMNCGEIFFLNIHVLHFWDPSTLFLVFAGKFLKIGALVAYQYDLLFRYLFFVSGGYLFFRYTAKHKISAFIAFVTLTFSSLCTSYLKQHAFILSFYLLPWILLFTFKYLEEKKALSLVWLAFFWGVTLYSYHAMYLISSVTVLLICLFVTKGLLLPKDLCSRDGCKYAIWAFCIFLLLLFNLLPVFLTYTRDTVPTARMFEAPMAAYSFPADFFNLFAPYSFVLHFFNSFYMSEAFLYIGLIPLSLAAAGILYSRHKYRSGFIFAAIVIALLMLGPKFLVLSVFSDYFPLFRIIRNTHTFGPFLVFCLAFFVCLGADLIFESAAASKSHLYGRRFLFIALSVSAAAVLITRHIINTYPGVCNLPVATEPLSTQGLNTALIKIFIRSYYNMLLFIVSCAAIFYLFSKPKIGLRIKYAAMVSLILIDLTFFMSTANEVVTINSKNASPGASGTWVYKNRRAVFIPPEYPFLGFYPAMQKKFAAVSSNKAWVTTHFYEMKDYFNFVTNDRIPNEVKAVLMGITASKIRVVNAAAVLPTDRQREAWGGLSAAQANNVLLIEEDPPAAHIDLKISPDDIGRARQVKATIKVLAFDPNGILLEVDSEEDGFLYYSDVFDKSWRVFVDGRENKIYRTNMAFKSVIVEKGDHIVRFVYDPALYKIAIFCYFTGIVSAAIALIYTPLSDFYRRRIKG